MMALVCGGTLNSSAANFRTAVNGAPSGTLKTLKGSLGSEVRVTLKETFPPVAIFSDGGGDQISTADNGVSMTQPFLHIFDIE